MISLGEILPPSHIVLDMETGSKKRLFEQIAQLLSEQEGLSQSSIFECLFAREHLGSTGLGQGVAIPHGRDADIQTPTGAFVRLKTPIAFDAPDGKPVSLVFVLLVPETATEEHLEILSHLASRFAQQNVREALLGSTNAEEARELLIA